MPETGGSLNLRTILIAAFAILFLTAPSWGQALKSTIIGEEHGNGPLDAIASHTVLVDSTRTIEVCDNGNCYNTDSQLRVSALTIDGGPSTDVSPRFNLYLSMYNYIQEFATATSLHKIDYLNRFISVKRIKAGIYEARYVAINLEGQYGNCFYPEIKATIDARELSATVRKAKRARFFSDVHYTDPIYVTKTVTGCSKH